MNKPYFEVGEEVMLASRIRPDLNGEYTVSEVLKRGIQTITSDDGGKHEIEIVSQYAYFLSELGRYVRDGFLSACKQESLRKNHKPSDESFSEIMANYKTPVHNRVD